MKGKTLRRLFAWLLSVMLLAACIPSSFAEEILSADEAAQGEANEEGTTQTESGTACEHKASPDPLTEWEATGEYMKTPETHAAVKAAFAVTVCEDCGEKLGRERTGEETAADAEAHSFGADGVCTVCGYNKQPAGEDEPNESDKPSEGTPCEHKASDIPKTDWVPVGEYMKTPETHAVAKAAFKVTVCELCGEELKREPMGGEMEPAPEAHTFVDGVCTVCGYALPAEDDEDGKSEESNETSESNGTNEPAGKTPCEHKAFDIPKTDWVPVGEYVTTPETHAVAKAAFKVTVCELCGEELKREPMGGEMEPTPEAHTFVDGVCTVCGYALPVAACEHRAAAAPLTEWKPVGEYVTTPETHAIAKAAFKVTVCELCGEELNREPMGGESEPQPEAHTFENGVCAVCGYAQTTEEEKDEPAEETECLHESVSSKTIWVTTRGYKIGQDTHAAITAEYKVTVCEDCGEELSRERTGKQGEADAEAHDFGVDCICTVCGYEKPIPPAKTGDDEDAEFSPMGSDQPAKTGDDEDAVFIPMGNGQPAADGVMPLSATTSVIVATPQSEAALQSGTECTHPNATFQCYTTFDGSETTYKHVDGTFTHAIIYDAEYYYCPDCKNYFPKKLDTPHVEEVHCDFRDGVCFFCKWENPCTHENARYDIWRDYYEPARDNGDGTHTISYGIRKHIICDICGANDAFVIGHVTDAVENHEFSPGGFCIYCYVDCTHTSKQITYNRSNISYDPVDALTHNATYAVTKTETCTECGQTLSENVVVETVTELQTHTFRDGKCDCGYKAGCSHEAAYDEIVTTPYAYAAKLGGVIVDKNASGHTYKAKVRKYCPTCKTYITSAKNTTGSETVTFAHEFRDSNACFYCDFISAECSHEHKKTEITLSNYRASDYIDETFHRVTADKVQQISCLDCGELVETKVLKENVELVEGHSFNRYGLCDGCGYVKPCAHAHTTIDREMVTVSKLTANNDKTHTGVMQVEERVYCSDCGKLISVTREAPQKVTADHVWELDYTTLNPFKECVQCGYRVAMTACKHEKRETENVYNGTVSVTPSGADGHKIVYSTVGERTYCADCGTTLDEKIVKENYEELFEHEFVNGKCVICGYVNACLHGKLYTYTEPSLIRNAKDNGNGTHTYIADMYTCTYCADCDEYIKEKEVIERNKTVTEAHSMYDGICSYCFAKAQQKPSTPPQSGSGDDGGSSTGGGRTGGTTAAAVVPVLPVEPVVTPPPAEMTVSEGLIVSVVNITSQLASDANATIEIVGAEDVMTKEEYQRFDRLSLSEQIMVMLSVAGATEDITSVLPPSATLLTTVAQTLITEITGRIETSGETPFQFEISDVAVNGAQYKCVTITFEITTDGVKTLTTRSFYFDPMLGEWVAMDEPAAA